jgi:pyroglutamyl-peptidase
MACSLLLTSFDIWLPHHASNSSDDLFSALIDRSLIPASAYLLRKLPVDFDLAPQQVIRTIAAIQPEAIICCGMAETRSQLTIELNGKGTTETLQTRVDLNSLVAGTQITAVSEDAGAFVCNHLYYSVLKYLQASDSSCICIFVHVPVLREQNLATIVQDFTHILSAIQCSHDNASKQST